MTNWKLQRQLHGVDNWEDCGEESFSTIREARDDLKEFINDCVEAYEMGYMSDYDAHDWRVAEVEV